MALDGWLKQSTAVTVLIGSFVDDTDGNTPETALTISQADVRLSKNAGNMAQKGDATACTHDELGYYTCPLSTTDTNTLGILKLMVHEAGALPVTHSYLVVPANVYDSLIAGSDALQVHTNEMTANLITSSVMAANAIGASQIATDAITAAKIAANAIGASELAADAVTEIQSGLATSAALATVDGNVDAILVDTGTTLPVTLATIASYLDTEIASVLEDTGTTLPAQIAALNNLSAAQVNAEVLDVLATDTFAELSALPDLSTGATIKDLIMLGAMALLHKLDVTASAKEIHTSDGTVLGTKSLSDDGVTYSEAKMA